MYYTRKGYVCSNTFVDDKGRRRATEWRNGAYRHVPVYDDAEYEALVARRNERRAKTGRGGLESQVVRNGRAFTP